MKKWTSGKGDILTFTINVHAQANLDMHGVQVINEAQNDFIDDAEGYCIAGELEFYEHFCHPSDPDREGGTGGGDFLVFSFGRYYRAAKYYVATCDIEVTELNGDGEPTVATVSFVLERVEDENRFAHQVFSYKGELRVHQAQQPQQLRSDATYGRW